MKRPSQPGMPAKPKRCRRSGNAGIGLPAALFGILPVAAVFAAKSFCNSVSKTCGEIPASGDFRYRSFSSNSVPPPKRDGRILNRYQHFRECCFRKAHAKPTTFAIELLQAVQSRAGKYPPALTCPDLPKAMSSRCETDCQKPDPYQDCQGHSRKTACAAQTTAATLPLPADRNLAVQYCTPNLSKPANGEVQSARYCRCGNTESRTIAGQS